MSRGIGANAKLYRDDDVAVIYKYRDYDLNDSRCGNEEQIYDGTLTIKKSCFDDLEMNEEIVKQPLMYEEMITDGRVKIENCGSCCELTKEDIDMLAVRIMVRIFERYKEDGKLPESVSYNV